MVEALEQHRVCRGGEQADRCAKVAGAVIELLLLRFPPICSCACE